MLFALELSAGEPTIELRWDAPAGCPARDAVADEIAARIGDHAPDARITADVRVTADDAGAYTVEVGLAGDVVGHRSVRASSCEEAATATAVVIAIAATSAHATEVPEAPPTPDPLAPTPRPARPAPPPATTIQEPPAPAAPADARPRGITGIAVAARGGVDVGSIPGVAPLVGGAVELLGARWHAWVGGLHRFGSRRSASGAADLGGRFRMDAGQLGAGPRLRWGTFELPLRAAIELGAITARGTGELVPRDSRRLWAAALVGAGARWVPIPRLAVELGVEAVVPLLRPRFRVGSIPIATVGPIGVRAWLGLSVRFSFEESRRAGNRRNQP